MTPGRPLYPLENDCQQLFAIERQGGILAHWRIPALLHAQIGVRIDSKGAYFSDFKYSAMAVASLLLIV